MNKSFVVLGAATVAFVPIAALAQGLTGDRAVEYNGVTIPRHQALPPAGHPEIAFRPACWQMVPVAQANGYTAWTLNMPNQVVILDELPLNWGEQQAHVSLSSSGLCKIGTPQDGVVNVPLIATSQLPQSVLVGPTAIVNDTGQPNPQAQAEVGVSAPLTTAGISMIVIAIAWISWIAWKYHRSQRQWPLTQEQPPNPVTGAQGQPAPVDKLTQFMQLCDVANQQAQQQEEEDND